MIKGVIFDLGWTLTSYDYDWNAVNVIAYKNAAAFLQSNGIQVGEDFPALFHAACNFMPRANVDGNARTRPASSKR